MRLLVAGFLALLVAATLRAEDAAVKAVLEKATKAQGGANNVAKLGENISVARFTRFKVGDSQAADTSEASAAQ